MVPPGSHPRKDLREPEGALQIPPLRFASVGMTRGGWLLFGWLATGMDRVTTATSRTLQIPPLRFAPVGMTRGGRLLFGRLATGMDRVTNRDFANTADPSTTLRFGRDDKGRVVTFRKAGDWDEQTYEPLLREHCSSTTLRFGRDDKGRVWSWLEKPQIPPRPLKIKFRQPSLSATDDSTRTCRHAYL